MYGIINTPDNNIMCRVGVIDYTPNTAQGAYVYTYTSLVSDVWSTYYF